MKVAERSLGAGRLATVDGPLANDTLVYNFDELGRVNSRTINSVGESVVFDALGRVSSHVTPLGTFTPGYVGDTERLATFAYPNGQTTGFDYFNHFGDHRLKQIWHQQPGGDTLSKFDYQHDALGRIKSWTRQADAATPETMTLEYDFEDQLVNALFTPQGGSPTKGITYGYDAMGNRTSEQTDTLSPSQVSTVTKSSFNNVKQLTARNGQYGATRLPVRFQGRINEPGTVTVNGVPARMTQPENTVNNEKNFTATVDLPLGQNTVAIVARDLSDNETTAQYDVTVVGGVPVKSFTYDANGNCTGWNSSGGPPATYEWDVEDRLVAVTMMPYHTEFTYDGFGRREGKSSLARPTHPNARSPAPSGRLLKSQGQPSCRHGPARQDKVSLPVASFVTLSGRDETL